MPSSAPQDKVFKSRTDTHCLGIQVIGERWGSLDSYERIVSFRIVNLSHALLSASRDPPRGPLSDSAPSSIYSPSPSSLQNTKPPHNTSRHSNPPNKEFYWFYRLPFALRKISLGFIHPRQVAILDFGHSPSWLGYIRVLGPTPYSSSQIKGSRSSILFRTISLVSLFPFVFFPIHPVLPFGLHEVLRNFSRNFSSF